MAEFDDIYWSWESSKPDARRTAYLRLAGRGRITLATLTAKLAELAPDIPPEEIWLHWATVRWSMPATPEEYAARLERERKQQRDREAWERKMVVELTAKYGPVTTDD